MHRLPRYVLFELLKVFAFVLVVLTGAMLIVGVVRQAANEGLPLVQIVRLIPFIIPEALRVTLPVALLLATTTVYSRMSGFNEVVAIKALGISPMVILRPTFILSFLMSLLTVWLNDVAVSWGRVGAQRVIVEAVEEIAYGMLRLERQYSSKEFSINVKRVEDRKLIHPTLSIRGRGSSPTITITADEAELQADRKENVLKIRLRTGTMEIEDRVTVRFPDEYEQEIPLSEASRAGGPISTNPSCLPLRQIPEAIQKQLEAIQRHREELAARAGFQFLSGEFEALAGVEWVNHANQAAGMHNHLCRLRTEPYRRWSAGFSCLCFVWVGAPMAIWLRNRDLLTSFFLCFAPILVVYYPLLAYGIDGAKNGTIPPIAVWAGNVILAVCGVYLLRKVLRY